MNPQRFLTVGIVLALLAALAPGALAGGWAVTTVDPIAGELTPGTSAVIGYTIRQHGRTPVDLADTGIEIRSADGAPTFFRGRREGPVGHYVATITVPAAGAQWTVRQDAFGPQDLGSVPVASNAGTSGATTAEATPGALRWFLLGATILAASALCIQLATRRHRTAAAG
jgi:hypothetical protein